MLNIFTLPLKQRNCSDDEDNSDDGYPNEVHRENVMPEVKERKDRDGDIKSSKSGCL